MPAPFSQGRIATALIAAALVAVASPASAQDVSEVAVNAPAPTTITIPLAGKNHEMVRTEVRFAARTVCSNAVRNDELDSFDWSWCRQTSAAKALRRYAAMTRQSQLAAAPSRVLVLSSR